MEIGRDDHSRSFVRVLDEGGMIREVYETVDEALAEADAAIAACLDR